MNLKKILILSCLISALAVTISFSDEFSIGYPRPQEEQGESREIVEHTGYALCYREEYEQAEWVSYDLTRAKLVKTAARQNNFRADPSVSTGSATPADYKKSGYDRGHMAPASDMAYSEQAMSESFFMSNMSPQEAKLNRGAWKDLESEIRVMAEQLGKIYIVTGPVLEKKEYKTIGENKVAVPEFYYKVLLAPVIKNSDDYDDWIMIGFILPNQECDGTIWDYTVSVDEVEKRTGLDFFWELDDEIEDSLEAGCDISNWKF